MQSETQILRAVLDLLESLRRNGMPILATRTNAGRVQTLQGRWIQLCDAGWPDVTAIINGIPVGIETKKPINSEQHKSQQDIQIKWEAAGGVYLLVRELRTLREYLGIEPKQGRIEK